MIILISIGMSQCRAAIEFDGSNDGIDLGTSTVLTPTTGFTMSGWIYINGANANFGTIYCSWTPSTSLYIGTKIAASSTIQVYFNGTNNFDITSVPLNQWVHIRVTHSGSTIFSYINGVQTNTTSGSLISNTGTKSIGYDVGRNNYPFKGSIDDIRIYNRALSAGEIEVLYNAKRKRIGGSVANGLVAHYEMDGGEIGAAASTIIDVSGNSNHGTGVGGVSLKYAENILKR